MKTLSNIEGFISRKSDSNILIAAFGVVYMASQVTIGIYLRELGAYDVWILQTTLSSDVFKTVAMKWIESGKIGMYYTHFYLDYFHPVWYSVFLSLLLARMLKINGLDRMFGIFILMPFAAGICDLFENTMHLYFLGDLSRATPTLVALSGTATIIKWSLAFSCVGAIMVMAASYLAGKNSK